MKLFVQLKEHRFVFVNFNYYSFLISLKGLTKINKQIKYFYYCLIPLIWLKKNCAHYRKEILSFSKLLLRLHHQLSFSLVFSFVIHSYILLAPQLYINYKRKNYPWSIEKNYGYKKRMKNVNLRKKKWISFFKRHILKCSFWLIKHDHSKYIIRYFNTLIIKKNTIKRAIDQS